MSLALAARDIFKLTYKFINLYMKEIYYYLFSAFDAVKIARVSNIHFR